MDAKLQTFGYPAEPIQTSYRLETESTFPETEKVLEDNREVMIKISTDDPEVNSFTWALSAEAEEAKILAELEEFKADMVHRNVDWMISRFDQLRDLSKSPSGAYLTNNIAREVEVLRKRVARRKKNYSPTPRK